MSMSVVRYPKGAGPCKKDFCHQEHILAGSKAFSGNAVALPDPSFYQINSRMVTSGFPILLCCRSETTLGRGTLLLCGIQEANYHIARTGSPALSGIATRQHEATGDQYLAGMWRDGLIWQLAWRVLKPAETKSRPCWRAPTWSWASIDSPVRYNPYMSEAAKEQKRWMHILDAWTTPSGPDSFGPVSDGVLTLGCAWLLRGRLDDENVTIGACSSKVEHSESLTMTIPITTDCLSDGPARNQIPVYLLPLLAMGTYSWQVRPESKSESLEASSSSLESDGDSEDREIVAGFGIALQRCGSAQGHFRRVGYFEVDSLIPLEEWDNDQGGRYGDFIRLAERIGPGVAETECAKALSDTELLTLGLSDDHWKGVTKPRYVITIE